MNSKLLPLYLGGRAKFSALFIILSSFLLVQARAGIGDIDGNGWTELTTSSDSLIVYVSSSTGNDENDGLTPETAKNTIDAANSLLRDGSPDWMLLKRGDTFLQPNLGGWKSGRSAEEPMVISFYGEDGPRPLIKLTDILVDWDGVGRSNIALVGLDLYRSISDPDSPDFTNTNCDNALRLVSFSSGTGGVLIEDCLFRFCWIVSQGGSANLISNFNLRRNIIADNWKHGSGASHDNRIQGIFVTYTEGVTIEENLFHHNGWSEDVEGAGANQYNHNVYMSTSNQEPILVRGNLFSYGAAHGVQLRSGGTAEMNAFIGNAIGMNIGYSSYPTLNAGETYVRNNVFTDGRPQVPNQASEPQSGAIWGLWRQLINNIAVDDNIVANVADTRGTNVRPYAGMSANEHGTGNLGWNWFRENAPATDPGWLDPTSNADSFADSLGFSDYAAWLDVALSRELGAMPFDLSAYSYVDYIRDGFNKASVSPPYSYELGLGTIGGPVAATGVAVIPPTLELIVGDTAQLTAFVLPSNVDDQSVVWSSSDPTVATVGSSGRVTPEGEGVVNITATSNEGGFAGQSSVTVLDFGKNVALDKPVVFSSVSGTTDMLVDGSTSGDDRWSAETFPQWAEIDLGANYDLKSFRLYPFSGRDYQYTISVAEDGSEDYQLVVDRSSNTEVGDVFVDNINVAGRKILLVVTGAASYSGAFCSINELEVYGTGGPPPVAVESVAITPQTNTLFVGDAIDLAATVSPSDALDQTVTWSSSDPGMASVDLFGKVTAHATGTVIITATTNDGGFTDQAEVVVKDYGVNIALQRPVLVDEGEGYKLVDGDTAGDFRWSAETFPQWAEIDLGANYDLTAFRFYPLEGRDYQYTISVAESGSDDYAVVVNRSGNTEGGSVLTDVVSARGRKVLLVVTGAASYQGPWCSVNELEVYGDLAAGGAAVTGVTLMPATLKLGLGSSKQLSAVVAPSDANNALVDWTSSDTAVATVNSSGQVLAEGLGSAVISATTRDGGFVATTDVTVIPPPYRAGSESFDNLSASTTDRFSAGNYIGDNGQVWNFGQVQRLEADGIDGVTAQVRRYSGFVETTLVDGLNTLRFEIKTMPGEAVSFARLEVFIDGVSQGIFRPSATDVPTEIVIDDIGKSGSVLVRFDGDGFGEVKLDNISWNEPADLDGDGIVDQADMALIRAAMGSRLGDSDFVKEADFDQDGVITRGDYNAWYRLARKSM